MVVTMKIRFWDVTRYTIVDIQKHFIGTYCLYLQGGRKRIRKVINKAK
jgi:hypothetical protein